MSEHNQPASGPQFALINLGAFAKPANTFIEKISAAVGTLYEPRRIREQAKAEKEAAITKAQGKIEITEMECRAVRRMVEEEAKHQANMEAIASKALPLLTDNALPQNIQDDWVSNFFERCRGISDPEMQQLWAKILAGEANTPGAFSRRTVNLLDDLDQYEATLFNRLAGFVWMVNGTAVPVIHHPEAAIYRNNGISFDALLALKTAGLIQFEQLSGFCITQETLLLPFDGLPKWVSPNMIPVSYHGRDMRLLAPDGRIEVGKVLFTRFGKELFKVTSGQAVEGFWESARDFWGQYMLQQQLDEARKKT